MQTQTWALSGWHTRLFLDGMPAVVMLNLAHLGHRTPSTVSCILPVTSSVQLRARPIRSRPGLASTNHRPARFKRTGRAVGSPPVSYICNVRSWAAATNCEERVIPTSTTNSLTISFWVTILNLYVLLPSWSWFQWYSITALAKC